MPSGPYAPTWNALKRHQTPEWLDDAKFGIYCHWGVYSVPAYGSEWYPNRMYNIGDVYAHHARTYGEPTEFSYKDLIPRFTAKHFNPDAWARAFQEAGAQFAGLVAEHHDGFSMWPSKVNRWNAMDMGPKRDVVGEVARAVREHGMKFLASFHHSHNWYYYYHHADLDTGDPEYADLYGTTHPAVNHEGPSGPSLDRPDRPFCDTWLAKIREVVDAYQPDLIWFDFGLQRIPDAYKRAMVAYYYNRAEEWGKDVEIIYKHHDLPPGVGLLDYERGRTAEMTWHKWITDTSVGRRSWSHVDEEEYKSPQTLVHNFVDRIAKNGALLLNVGPKADGTIPAPVLEQLRAVGRWLAVNREAVFNSTPWVMAGEGPTRALKSGGFSEQQEVTYTPADWRFVTREKALYAFCLGWPGAGATCTIKSLTLPPQYKWAADRPRTFYLIEPADIAEVRLLGHPTPLAWRLTPQGLQVDLPGAPPCDHAVTLKIVWTG